MYKLESSFGIPQPSHYCLPINALLVEGNGEIAVYDMAFAKSETDPDGAVLVGVIPNSRYLKSRIKIYFEVGNVD